MAGPIASDRKLAANVRRLLLTEIERLFLAETLTKTEQATKRDLLLRMAPNTLPRLHEVTGEDGGPLEVTIIKYASDPATTLIPSSTVPITNSSGV